MRTFRSPGERKLLDRLPWNEARLVTEMMDTFDAHLVAELEPTRAPKENESMQDVLRFSSRVIRDESR